MELGWSGGPSKGKEDGTYHIISDLWCRTYQVARTGMSRVSFKWLIGVIGMLTKPPALQVGNGKKLEATNELQSQLQRGYMGELSRSY